MSEPVPVGCCEQMRDTVADGDVYVVEGGEIFFPYDGAYDGREYIKFCPWCGKKVEVRDD